MGIHGFAKAFDSKEEVTLKDLKNQTLAIDASTEIYRAALGMQSVKGLTDKSGRSTLHISVLLSNMIKNHLNKIDMIWVFDFDPNKAKNKECHNPLKLKELEKRKKRRDEAKKKIKELKKKQEELLKSKRDKMSKKELAAQKKKEKMAELFSDSDEDSDEPTEKMSKMEESEKIKEEINKKEKQTFHLESWMVNDIKLILNLLGIQWVESPEGFEAECVAANLTSENVAMADAVFSPDADALLYGASTLIKKNIRTKKLERMYLSDILEEKEISQEELIKMGIIMGSDMYKDKKKYFYRIGPKTAIKKIRSGKLDKAFKDPEVIKAVEHFQHPCDTDNLEWHNDSDDPFTNVESVKMLIDWLVNEKSFNRKRITNQLKKVVDLE